MTLVDRLKQYNAWRRGECDDPQPNPTQLGKDIDEAIAKLAAAEKLAEAVEEVVQLLVTPTHGSDIPSVCIVTPAAGFPAIKDALTTYQSQTRKEQHDE